MPDARKEVATGQLHVSLVYEGDLAEIEALGFEAIWRERPGRASGPIDLANLERIAANPNVLKISYGQPKQLHLDVSAVDVGARDGVWTFHRFPEPEFTGKIGLGTFVGVIDSGIDFRHPYFRDPKTGKTRIYRIWDQGLWRVAGVEHQPDVALLDGGGTSYGVEYTDDDINKLLEKDPAAKPIRHRDCVGHGTHVASIAAGTGKGGYSYIGIAPGAQLIIVKYLALLEPPEVGGKEVEEGQRLRDAVSYILKVAAGKPVAINYSIGSDLGPHDGFTDDEDYLATTFENTKDCVFVTSAGNAGSRRQHGYIDFPGGGDTIEIPFLLADERTDRKHFFYCKSQNSSISLGIDLYYENGPTDIEVTLTTPGGTPIPGPALGTKALNGDFGHHKTWVMSHGIDETPLRSGVRVKRKRFSLTVSPYRNYHVVGIYKLRVHSPAALKLNIWCHYHSQQGFHIDGSAPPSVHVTRDNTIGSDAGAANTITVAAYNAEDITLPIANFSSAGRLVNYGGPAQPLKPDIAAPGFKIDAARSSDLRPKMAIETEKRKGTSMAAPHVTGAAALLMEKKPGMTTKDIIAKLKDFARPGGRSEDFGAGRLDVKKSWDNT